MSRLRGAMHDPLLSVGYDEGKKIGWRDGVIALWVLLRYRFSE